MRALLLLLAATPVAAATLDIHYAPVEDLEAIDVGLIESAERTIDMAAYVLTDRAILEALGDAADRGVAVRIYLDAGEYRAVGPTLAGLAAQPGVEARLKPPGPLMHMKAYAIDRARLRTGSGNFTRVGLSRQDNDLLVTDDAAAVMRFESDFESIFAAGEAL